MAANQDYRVHPDTFLWLIIGIVVCILLYHFPPVKIKITALRAYIYSIESVVCLDFENAKKMKILGDYLTKASISEMKKIDVKKLDEYMEQSFDRIRLKLFVIFLILNIPFLYLIRSLGKDKPFRKGQYSIKELLVFKYKFNPPDKDEPVESVYKRLQDAKRRMNLPVNLVARLYPKGSKERVYIYKGSYNYKLISKHTQNFFAKEQSE